MTDMATFSTDRDTVRFTGSLSLVKIGDLPERLRAFDGAVARLDLSAIERMDTVGAWLIHRFAAEHDAEVVGLDSDGEHLLAQVSSADQPVAMRPAHVGSITRVVGEIGAAVEQTGRTLYGLLGFLGATLIAFWHVATHPKRFRFNAVVQRFEVVGVSALAIVGLMSFLIGIVIAQQGAVQLQQFGAEFLTINLVGRITLRELGAAQIGTMKLTEEVDAMRTIGVSPMEALVLPRVLATVIMMPLLGMYASIVTIIGGGLLCWITLDIPPVTFIQRLREVVPITDLYVGLIKAPVFGLIIAVAGCFQGMLVEGDAEQVGTRTTSAVVQAIFLVIVVDAFFAVFFTSIGWV